MFLNGEIMEINALELFNKVYPVGSIYMSVNSTNPSNLFGGTWVAWGSGKVPVGVNASDSDFNSVEKTGGEKRHSYTHSHTIMNAYAKLNINMINNNAYFDYTEMRLDTAPTFTETDRLNFTQNYGWAQETNRNENSNYGIGVYADVGESSVSIPILQPYITCYMWKRTA